MLNFEDVSGRRWIDTGLMKRIVVAEENAAAALEAMSRFAMAPQWLIHLPPTMSPVETSAFARDCPHHQDFKRLAQRENLRRRRMDQTIPAAEEAGLRSWALRARQPDWR